MTTKVQALKGFRPATTTGSNSSARIGKYPKAAAEAPNNRIVVGDLVYLNASGQVLRYGAASSTLNNSIIGVAAGVLDANGNQNVFAKPAGSGKVAASAAAGFVLVYDDPDQIFICATTTAKPAGLTHVGKVATVDSTDANYRLTLGQSGQTVDVSAAVSGDAILPLRIVGLTGNVGEYSVDASGNVTGLSNGGSEVLVKINNHKYNSTV